MTDNIDNRSYSFKGLPRIKLGPDTKYKNWIHPQVVKPVEGSDMHLVVVDPDYRYIYEPELVKIHVNPRNYSYRWILWGCLTCSRRYFAHAPLPEYMPPSI